MAVAGAAPCKLKKQGGECAWMFCSPQSHDVLLMVSDNRWSRVFRRCNKSNGRESCHERHEFESELDPVCFGWHKFLLSAASSVVYLEMAAGRPSKKLTWSFDSDDDETAAIVM